MIKCLATSFTSTLPLVLLSAMQTFPLSLDAISKSFHYTNLGNYSIQYYYIINLKGFINYKQYCQAAPLKYGWMVRERKTRCLLFHN